VLSNTKIITRELVSHFSTPLTDNFLQGVPHKVKMYFLVSICVVEVLPYRTTVRPSDSRMHYGIAVPGLRR
jgi:hypothetical protein